MAWRGWFDEIVFKEGGRDQFTGAIVRIRKKCWYANSIGSIERADTVCDEVPVTRDLSLRIEIQLRIESELAASTENGKD